MPAEQKAKKKHPIWAAIVALLLIGGIYNAITGNTENGVFKPKYKKGIAIIKVDDYTFEQDSAPDWWRLCDEIITAAKHSGVKEIHLDLVAQPIDKYGNTTKKHYDVRMDDPEVRPISEIRKYSDGSSLYESLGFGFMAQYVLALNE